MLLSTSKEEEEEREVWVVLLRGREDGESGTVEFMHRDVAIVFILWYAAIAMFAFTTKKITRKREK